MCEQKLCENKIQNTQSGLAQYLILSANAPMVNFGDATIKHFCFHFDKKALKSIRFHFVSKSNITFNYCSRFFVCCGWFWSIPVQDLKVQLVLFWIPTVFLVLVLVEWRIIREQSLANFWCMTP